MARYNTTSDKVDHMEVADYKLQKAVDDRTVVTSLLFVVSMTVSSVDLSPVPVTGNR